MRILGLDLGTKTLGVALSDETKTVASNLKTIRFENENYDSLISEIDKLIKDYNVELIVLGLPKNMNNTIGTRAEIALDFKEKIQNNLNIEVEMQDERLSSKEANNIMISGNVRRNKRKKKVDSLAASIILQTYLDKKKGR